MRQGAIGAIKRNQSGKCATGRDFEYRTIVVCTAGLGRAIQGVVTALHQRSPGIGAVVGSVE